jgi:hypothetical protein
MSNYFAKFPKVAYLFGNEEQPVSYQKLTKYSDVIDQIREAVSAYTEYEIQDFERPDTLSYRLYGTSEYEWTFFLMNERLRETGWPMPVQELYERIQTDFFKHYTAKLAATTESEVEQYANLYPVGQQVVLDGVHSGTVIRKNLDVGEITISSDDDITTSTLLAYEAPDPSQPLTSSTPLTNTVYEYEGTHHYENAEGEWLDKYFDDLSGAAIKTNLEYLVDENDASKRIRLIKKNDIEAAVAAFKRALETL